MTHSKINWNIKYIEKLLTYTLFVISYKKAFRPYAFKHGIQSF